MKGQGKKLLLILLTAFLLITLLSGTALAVPPSDYAALAYPSFVSTDGLTLSGNASLDAVNSRIRIVPYATGQAGGVFTTDKVSMGSNGFSMAAQVYCGSTSAQADGFALVLSQNINTCTGDTGGSLSYAGMTDSIAVQYFTYAASHIALGVNGNQNRNNSTYVGFGVPSNGYVYIWADYDAANTRLAVYADTTSTRPTNPVTTYTIDLSGYSDYYLGVTSATGDSCQEYALAQWYYDDYYNSGSLKRSSNYTDDLAADEIIAQSATDVTSDSATLRGVWGSDYASGYTNGIAYKEGLAGEETEVAAAADGTVDVNDLIAGTLYYYRAYAIDDNTDTYYYSNDKAFTTLNTCTVTVEGGGYIGANTSTTTAEVDEGDSVTVTAPAKDGQIFDYWDISGSPVSSDNPYTFTVSGDTTVTAVYFDGFAGFGTEANPYQIADKDDLDLLSSLVAEGYDFDGEYFIVTQNIQMQDTNTEGTEYFTPIGSYDYNYMFSGTFDGNGKTISGLIANTDDYAGLFAYIDAATIKDLTVTDAEISAQYCAGAIVGYADYDSSISGCSVTNSYIDADYEAGGICGDAYENNIFADCTVTNCEIFSNDKSGGIVGYTGYDTDIADCTVTGSDINGYNEASGICGYAENNIDISGCTVTDCPIVGYYYAGGIAGYVNDYSTISNCTVISNTSEPISINSSSYAGGIIGYLNEYNTIYNCNVSGYSIIGVGATGGILGEAYDDTNILDCDVTSLTIDGYYAGGIVGYLDDYDNIGYCTATDCIISGDYYAGGIAAFMYYEPTVTYCTVTGGSISSQQYLGGIIGYADDCDYTATISNCQVTCDLTATGTGYEQYVGGILGYGYSGVLNIANCEYNGDITAESTSAASVGGIVGYNDGYDSGYEGTSISNCVAYGTVTAPTGSSFGNYVAGIYGNSDDYDVTLTNNVAMQSSLTGQYANSLCAFSYYQPVTSNNYVSGDTSISYSSDVVNTDGNVNTEFSCAAEEKAIGELNSAFWTNLGFTAANGWRQTTTGNVTDAPVEAHLSEASTYALTVSGNAAPYYMGIALHANSNGAYTVYQGMEITMQADSGYKISQVNVNGTPVASPWTFTVTGNTSVFVTTAENSGDFWVYDGYYVYGVYDEDSDYDDIDWSDSKYSYDEPISGAYSNANVYVLDYEELYIDQLNLGYGSVICSSDDDELYLCGYDDDSYLIADSIINEYDSGDVYIEDLDVYVNSIYINDELDIDDCDVLANTVTIVINCCGVEVSGNSTLTAGTIYAAADDYVDGACMYIYDNSVLTADDITGTLYFEASDNAVVNIANDLETAYFEIFDNGLVNIGGDLITTYNGSDIFQTSLLNVGGTITALDGNYIYSLNAAILNAESDSDTPYYNGTSEAYIRTTLNNLPVNTLMHFVTSGGTNNMDFWARTNYAGILTVWLIPDGGTITATTAEGIEYSCADAIGDPAATFTMGHVGSIYDVTITADVPEEQVSGQTISYDDDITVDNGDPAFAYDESCLHVYLTDSSERDVPLATQLPEGTYYLTICYADESNSFYGTATYTVHVRDQRTISFDTNGGSSIADVLAWKYDDLTLPTSTRSGYRLTGWSDGAITFAAGSDYQVYVDTILTAQWVQKASSGNNDEEVLYTITASAGEGGSISPDGSVEVTENGSKSFTITPDQGYVIDDVTVDGKSVGAIAKYTFTDVTANHTIKATFVVGEEETNLTGQFTDLTPGAWYIEGIEYVLQAGLFNGTSATQFSPDLSMSRAMLVTVLWRLGGTTDTSINSFDDVLSGQWYSDAVIWASANGIVNGFGNNKFRPDDNITREQLAVILFNYAKFMGYDTTQTANLSNYTDNGEISDWAAAAMAWANATGLITGRTDTTLEPSGTATRAEVATILMRFIETYAK